jgi:hypothetical protein
VRDEQGRRPPDHAGGASGRDRGPRGRLTRASRRAASHCTARPRGARRGAAGGWDIDQAGAIGLPGALRGAGRCVRSRLAELPCARRCGGPERATTRWSLEREETDADSAQIQSPRLIRNPNPANGCESDCWRGLNTSVSVGSPFAKDSATRLTACRSDGPGSVQWMNGQ